MKEAWFQFQWSGDSLGTATVQVSAGTSPDALAPCGTITLPDGVLLAFNDVLFQGLQSPSGHIVVLGPPPP